MAEPCPTARPLKGSRLAAPVLLREAAARWVQVEAAAVAALARHEVGGRGARERAVVGELLVHHLRRGALGEPEPLSELDAALEREAVRDALVALAMEVPGL